jgi:hypothetical protein
MLLMQTIKHSTKDVLDATLSYLPKGKKGSLSIRASNCLSLYKITPVWSLCGLRYQRSGTTCRDPLFNVGAWLALRSSAKLNWICLRSRWWVAKQPIPLSAPLAGTHYSYLTLAPKSSAELNSILHLPPKWWIAKRPTVLLYVLCWRRNKNAIFCLRASRLRTSRPILIP